MGEAGNSRRRNTHLKELTVDNNGVDIPAYYFRDFARGLAFNRSIQKLSIGAWDSNEAWEHLTRFFINNEALECLELELHWDVGNHRELITALRRFASLKEVKLSNYYPRNGGARVDDVMTL